MAVVSQAGQESRGLMEPRRTSPQKFELRQHCLSDNLSTARNEVELNLVTILSIWVSQHNIDALISIENRDCSLAEPELNHLEARPGCQPW